MSHPYTIYSAIFWILSFMHSVCSTWMYQKVCKTEHICMERLTEESKLVKVNKAINGLMVKTTTGNKVAGGDSLVLALVEDHLDFKMWHISNKKYHKEVHSVVASMEEQLWHIRVEDLLSQSLMTFMINKLMINMMPDSIRLM